jgi:Na+-transporting NADH:ubiquinone oxidoreductase subunit NqrE
MGSCFLLFLVPIQSNAMFINNMLLHTFDSICKVLRNNTFLGLHHAIVIIRSLSHGVAQDAPHALDKLDLN